MLNQVFTITAFLFLSVSLIGQDCTILNDNGTFEETIYVPGGEPSIGITTGQISNWAASHGTADYITSDWNWYDLDGITSNAGHLCYGNRPTHDHSEGIYTSVDILADDDLLYTLSIDYATVCDASENGFLNIALNNKLNSEGHNWFQYPTPTALPDFFDEIQPIERLELITDANYEQNGMSTMEVSFVPQGAFSQIWLFTEYQHDFVDLVNCGLILDNVKLTATTTALTKIISTNTEDNLYEFTPEFAKDLDIDTYTWIVDQDLISNDDVLKTEFETGEYTICLDITDSRGACGSACYELIVNESVEEEIVEEISNVLTTDITDSEEDEDLDIEEVSSTFNSDDTSIGTDGDNDIVADGKPAAIGYTVLLGSNLQVKPLNANVKSMSSQGAIFNSAGQLIMKLDDVNYFDEVNLDHLPVGVYVLNLIDRNNKRKQSTTFFKGDEVI